MALATPRALAPLLDHTVLAPDAGAEVVARACDEAIEWGFAGVCVREEHLARVVQRLAGHAAIAPIAVADFPRGDAAPAARQEEVHRLARARWTGWCGSRRSPRATGAPCSTTSPRSSPPRGPPTSR